VPSAHPANPNHLVGSKWTRVIERSEQASEAQSSEEARDEPITAETCTHYVVTVHRARTGEVDLASVLLPGQVIRIPWRALRERTHWLPGWS
jgi:Tryptophan-rich protein (DUF2389)